MSDIVYCTIERIKEITAIVKTVDPSYIEPHIENTEILDISPVLGCALDEELKDDILNGTLSGVNETLVEKYIIPASAWMSYQHAIPFMAIKSFNKGLVRQASDNSTAADLDEIRYLQQQVLDVATSMINRLVDYLTDNEASYPNYRNNTGSCDSCETTGFRNASGIFLG